MNFVYAHPFMEGFRQLSTNENNVRIVKQIDLLCLGVHRETRKHVANQSDTLLSLLAVII